MKATNLLALGALCIICVVSGKLESGTSSVYNLNSGSRHKRQMQVGPGGGTCSDEEQTRRLTAVVCNPVTGQRIVDVYLECNRDTTARGLVHSCIRNENQSFCFDVAVGASDYTNFVMTNCPRLSTYSGYQCTNSCRDALQNLKWNIGCCLNTRNYNASATFSNFLDAGLWSACRISRPGFCTDSTLMLGSVTSRNCSNEYLNEQMITQIYCSAEVFKPYIDVFQQCGFPSYYDYYINLCRVNENNEFCYRIASNVANYLRAIESQCHLDFTQGCFHSCQAALNNFKTAFGCCVNATISGSTVPNAINPAFWSACGISFPENCRSTLLFKSANPPSSTNQTNASTTNQPGDIPARSLQIVLKYNQSFIFICYFITFPKINMHAAHTFNTAYYNIKSEICESINGSFMTILAVSTHVACS